MGIGRPRSFVVGMSLLLLAGCAASPSPPQSSSAPSGLPSSLGLEVIPGSSVGRAIGGQRMVFLMIADGPSAAGAVELAATATAASVSILPPSLAPGVVGEVTVVPDPLPASATEPIDVTVKITGTRGELEQTVERTFPVAPGTDELGSEAAAHLSPFLAWLAAERPDLGIDSRTSWEPTPGTWVLVVNHYAFFSKDWELELSWHVMIPPDDWARIALRRRWTEASPSLAFEISSFSAATEPHEIDPPEAVWR